MGWVASFASLAAMRLAGCQARGDAKRKRLPVIIAHILRKLLCRSCPTQDEPEVSTSPGNLRTEWKRVQAASVTRVL